MYTYYISVGSNMGDRKGYIETAFAALQAQKDVITVQSSTLWETEPWGFTEQDIFMNALWIVKSKLAPHDMLGVLQSLEQAAQRQRIVHWGPRTLDLDIVYAFDAEGNCIHCDDDVLQLPHPFFWERLFVLEPLQELVPNFVYHGESIGDRITWLGRERK